MNPERSSTPQSPPPVPLAMLICDLVWREPSNGKFLIVGTFSSIMAKEFPVVHGNIGIFLALTDGRGKVPLRLRLVDVNEEEGAIFEIPAEIEFSDPKVVAEFGANVPQVKFPLPGDYRLQLYASDKFLMERRIVVHQIREAVK